MPYVALEYALENIEDYAGTSVCIAGPVLASDMVCCDGPCPEEEPWCCCEAGNMSMWTPEIEYPGVELAGLLCQVGTSPPCSTPSCPLASGHTYVTCGQLTRLPEGSYYFRFRQEVTHHCHY
jgi:hypothetical protein